MSKSVSIDSFFSKLPQQQQQKQQQPISVGSKCPACLGPMPKENLHPLLQIPVCASCKDAYNDGEFTIEDKNEIYCRFCGEGEGDSLLLCDACPKSFCARCLTNSLGIHEYNRMKSIEERWCCLICSPQPLRDLCIRKGWKFHESVIQMASKNHRKNVVCPDISRGTERYEIPVINEVDKLGAPLDFTYITRPVCGDNVKITNNPNLMTCCSCVDNCRDPTKCECARITDGQFGYDSHGRLVEDPPGGLYECNARCACHVGRCGNRVVGNGPQLQLEVFRCRPAANGQDKGWGVRCKTDIEAGAFVADYLGEILMEADGDKRGLTRGDEYIFGFDSWGQNVACQRLEDLGLKTDVHSRRRYEDVDSTLLTTHQIADILQDEELMELLNRPGGSIQQAQAEGSQLRVAPDSLVHGLLRDEEQQRQRKRSSNGGSEGIHAPVAQDVGNSSAPTTSGSKNKKKQNNNNNNNNKGKKRRRRRPEDEGWSSGSQDSDLEDSNGEVDSARRSDIADDDDIERQEEEEEEGVVGGILRVTSWKDARNYSRQLELEKASEIIKDRILEEVEQENPVYACDARWYGNVARFINHSCSPNLEKISVFSESHDLRMPRMALFASEKILAGTELTYSYGYVEGDVLGKRLACLCGAANCVKRLY